MSEAFKCDRCGEYEDAVNRVTIDGSIVDRISKFGVYQHKMDLCTKCLKLFLVWWRREKDVE